MPVQHHLIMYTCACYARHLALSYVLAGCIWQPWILISRSWSLDRGGLAVVDQSAQQKRGLTVACPDPPSSLPLIGSRDSHLATREYFPVFHIVHPAFMLLSDHIFLRYYIMPCDNCVLVLLLLIIFYHCASVLWFLPVLMLSVYTWGYFRPAYIRRSNVSVPAWSGRYTFHLCFQQVGDANLWWRFSIGYQLLGCVWKPRDELTRRRINSLTLGKVCLVSP